MVRLSQWARVLAPGSTGLRAGAWYSVVARTPREVQVVLRGRNVSVPRSAVELRDTPPHEWTVVRPPPPRDHYMVCPGCRHRLTLPERSVTTARCSRCNQAYAVGWGGVERLSPPGLRADRRVARRRTGVERRKRPRDSKDRRGSPERRQPSTNW